MSTCHEVVCRARSRLSTKCLIMLEAEPTSVRRSTETICRCGFVSTTRKAAFQVLLGVRANRFSGPAFFISDTCFPMNPAMIPFGRAAEGAGANENKVPLKKKSCRVLNRYLRYSCRLSLGTGRSASDSKRSNGPIVGMDKAKCRNSKFAMLPPAHASGSEIAQPDGS